MVWLLASIVEFLEILREMNSRLKEQETDDTEKISSSSSVLVLNYRLHVRHIGCLKMVIVTGILKIEGCLKDSLDASVKCAEFG